MNEYALPRYKTPPTLEDEIAPNEYIFLLDAAEPIIGQATNANKPAFNAKYLKSPYSIPYNIFCNSEVTIHDFDPISILINDYSAIFGVKAPWFENIDLL